MGAFVSPGPVCRGRQDNLVVGTQGALGAQAPTPGSLAGNLSWFRGHGFANAGASHDTLVSLRHVDHGCLVGSPAFLHARWQKGAGTAGRVAWRLNHSTARGNVDAFPAPQAADVISEDVSMPNYHHVTESTAVTTPDLEPDALVLCPLQRVHDRASDTFAGAAELLTFDFHHESGHAVTTNRVRNPAGDPWDR